ncbi:MAG: ribosome small subunit-dependent GTPase A [Deltaproteobacteria bacterium]|nr:ribosome small subunit-dependent GTPase A [Deltaproteobacteria bacterium]
MAADGTEVDPRAATGMVVEMHGMLATVLLAGGERVRCRPPRARTTPVIGDRVTIDRGDDPPRILEIAPRARTFARPAPAGPSPIATHIDRLVIVTSVFPGPRPGLVDRMWSALDDASVEVVLVLNKVDLPGADEARAALGDLVAAGARLVETSTRSRQGIAGLAALLGHGLSVLAGHSGVGKSSLLNALVPAAGLGIGEVHGATGKGRHTTTVATVHALGAGLVVDTPGVRAFPLDGLPLDEVARRFPGFHEPAARCHFAGCLHEGEPGCAVADEAPPERLARWLQLLAALREEAATPEGVRAAAARGGKGPPPRRRR